MFSYLLRRMLQSLVVIFGVSIVTFALIFLTGDPTYLLLGDVSGGMTHEQIEAFRHSMGFDRPWIVQYVDYMAKAIQGDFGKSYYHGVPNLKLMAEHVPATLQLGTTSFLLSLVGIPLGVLAATFHGRSIDRLSMVGAVVGQSMPGFWQGLLLMLVFAVALKWLPVSGRGSFKNLVLPAVTLASNSLARNARMVRSTMLEVLGEDFVRTARAKGLSERTVLYRHALRNTLIPVLTLIGMQVGYLLGGAVIVETIFAWPGMGRLIVQAINTRDIPLVQASTIVFALIFVIVNLLVDLCYGWVDPRIRLLANGTSRR